MAAAINLPHANRKFYHFPKNGEHKSSFNPTRKASSLIGYIEENLIGRNKVFSGPYGLRRALYCDYTASGQALEFIEDYIRDQVLTDYGNTHTTTSVTSLQTTLFRHEARDIIRNAVNASEHDAVIFTGSGCTGAVHKLIHAMNIEDAPVVFVSPYEHHSNLLPWKELDATVVRISQTPDGIVSLSNLEEELKKWKNSNRQLIGCFSAASNITGILSDVDAITVILHQFGALAFWDYATAGPYVNINVNPVMTAEGNASKDAILISTHKFVGGVQTPGVLVAKKVLFTNPVPSTCGGGSVFYVRRDAHRYLQEVEMREEGGTPAIVESVRAGLVFQLKEALTPTVIMEREHQLCRRALQAWSDIPNLVMLGSTSVPRLPIFSFLIRNEKSGLFLHHNFVCALLNDLFGIQARGGCACAGPYAHDLLGINEELAEKIESILVEDSRLDRVHLRRYREYSEKEILRPGFVRLNIPFFMTDENIDFVLNAVKLVCEHGWKMLPKYIFNPETGEWRHRNHQVFKDRKWLGSIGYTEGRMTYPEPQAPDKGPLPSNIQDCLDKAADLLTQAEKSRVQLADQRLLFDELAESIRWFLLPSEAQSLLNPKTDRLTFKQPPFSPPVCAKFIQLSVENNCQSPPIEGATHNDVHAVKVAGNSFEDASQCKNEDLQNMLENVSDDGFIDSVIPDGQVESGNVDTRLKNCDGASGEECQPAHSVVGDIPCDEDVDRTNNESISKRCHVVTREGSGTCRLPDTQGGIGVDAKIEVLPANQEVSKEDTHTRLNVGQQQVSDGGASQVSDGGASHFVTTFESVAKTEKAKSDINIGRNANTTQSQSIFCELTDGSVSSFGKESNDSVSKSQSTDTNTSRQKTKSGTNTEQSQSNSAQNNATSDNSCARKPKRAASKWFPPPKKIFKPTVEALEEYGMVRDGDRVLVCLSGGKDSLSLLHCMRQYQFYCRKKGIVFELGAVTVDPQTSSYDPSPLKQYTASLGVPYFYEEQCILDTATNLPDGCTSICSFCSRMKRGRIYACARREGYNVLAMGQHLDDLAESFIMSMFHNGALRTMKANYTVEEGDLRVIRPFVYVREKDLRDFAAQNRLPVIAENCPACFEAPKERHRTKQLLAAQEVLFPNLYSSMTSAMRPLMSLDRTGVNIAQVLSGTQGHAQYNEVDL